MYFRTFLFVVLLLLVYVIDTLAYIPSPTSSLRSIQSIQKSLSNSFSKTKYIQNTFIKLSSVAINPTESTNMNSIQNISRLFLRCSWISWWFQIILSVISSTILTFANTVRQSNSLNSLWMSGFSLSTIGVVISLLNAMWTWNITRVARRIQTKKIVYENAIPNLRYYAKTSVIISLIGMLVTLLGAEQIVGNLASKVLSAQALIPSVNYAMTAQNSLQALDIFLVQANTNTLLSHFSPLSCYIWLQTQIPIDKDPIVDPIVQNPLPKT